MDYFDIYCAQIAFQGINEILASLVHSDFTCFLIITFKVTYHIVSFGIYDLLLHIMHVYLMQNVIKI